MRRYATPLLVLALAACGGEPAEKTAAIEETSTTAEPTKGEEHPEKPGADTVDPGPEDNSWLLKLGEQRALGNVQMARDKGDVETLTVLLDHPSRNVVDDACQTLSPMGSEAAPAIPKLAKLVKTEGNICAMAMLVNLGEASIPALVSLLGADTGLVNEQVVDALGDMGPVAARAVPSLTAMLSRESGRFHVIDALGWIGPGATEAVTRLEEIAKSDDPDAKDALEALRRIAPERFDPDYPRVAPWVKKAKELGLPRPFSRVVDIPTSHGTVVVLDSPSRVNRGSRYKHRYLLGIEGPSGPTALRRLTEVLSVVEAANVEHRVLEFSGAQVAVELTVDASFYDVGEDRAGILIALPSLKMAAGFVALSTSPEGEPSSTDIRSIELRPRASGPGVEIWLIHEEKKIYDVDTEKEDVFRTTEKKVGPLTVAEAMGRT